MASSLPNGSIYLQAGSAADLVRQLHLLSQLPPTLSLSTFMVRLAAHLKTAQPGVPLRTDTEAHFITDLMRAGYIKTM
ncbi:hypothetical protein GO755_36720 [Spirosoma sp. HMF4905]|uniref:Uncharacterized protein n=2 Tax=Spirosoma arboris TaxID=2682092 RepID=A0A7K1SP97_9BACT|nr:hypothetical protein [Spirosoma arboris]